MGMYACGAQRKPSGIASQGPSTFFFGTRSLTDWNWPCRLEGLAGIEDNFGTGTFLLSCRAQRSNVCGQAWQQVFSPSELPCWPCPLKSGFWGSRLGLCEST